VFNATLLEPQRVFTENVWSALPYIEIVSPELYDYTAVLMDEERILGLRVCVMLLLFVIALNSLLKVTLGLFRNGSRSRCLAYAITYSKDIVISHIHADLSIISYLGKQTRMPNVYLILCNDLHYVRKSLSTM